MIAMNIMSRLRELISDQIGISPETDGAFAVDIPISFPDGDQCRVFVSHNDDGTWTVRDGGTSVMRASYARSVNIIGSGFADRFQQVIAMHGLSEKKGELFSEPTYAPGEAVFSVAQAAIDVVQLANTPAVRAPREASQFESQLGKIVASATKGHAITHNWHDPDHDSDRLYNVTYRIDAITPVYIFGVHNKTACMHATMSCFFHRTQGRPFYGVAIYEAESEITRNETKRLNSAVDQRFKSLDDPNQIRHFIANAIA
jgi:hypothetical protein